MKIINRILLFSIFLLLSACSMSKDASLAEQEVVKFHEQLDAGQFEALYDNSGEDLKKAATKQDFIDLLAAVNKKLGNVQKSEKTSWNVNYHTSGAFVTLTYNTTFTNGNGAEQFVFKLKDKHGVLVGYHINSNTLITK